MRVLTDSFVSNAVLLAGFGISDKEHVAIEVYCQVSTSDLENNLKFGTLNLPIHYGCTVVSV